jgi:hypothetical protein
MKARLFASVVLGVFAMGLALSVYGQGAPAPLGQIKAVRVVGDVKVLRGPGDTTIALHDNDAVTQGDVVLTAKDSSVVLVFSNGSTVNLAQDSRLAIDQFLQDPFGQEVKLADLKEEPSASHTKLNLTYGELVGNVKKLKGDSSFLVQTPVGAAGIRGTTFLLTYRPSGTGQAFFSLSTASGEIIFQGTTGEPVPVAAGKEVQVQVTIDSATGAVQGVQVVSQDISPAAQQTIAAQVTQALESVQTTTFTNPTPPTPTPEPTPPPPPPPPPTPPRTTPGDGQTG